MNAKIISSDPNITPDERDNELLNLRLIAWNARSGPRVGDFLITNNNTYRFTHHWKFKASKDNSKSDFTPAQDFPTVDRLQITYKNQSGSFYLAKDGYANYSGSLDSGYDTGQLINTELSHDGKFWFFHHDFQQAHSAIYCTLPCRVYKLKEEEN